MGIEINRTEEVYEKYLPKNTLPRHYNKGYPESFSDKRGLGRPLLKEEMEWAIDTGYIIPALDHKKMPSVEELLDYVDLELNWYTPSIEAFEFINFIRLCIGGEPENLNSKAHYFFVDSLLGCWNNIRPYFTVRGIDIQDMLIDTLILSTREFSKSTLVNYFILYMADKGKIPRLGDKTINYGIYISDKMEKGNVAITMGKLETFVKTSEYLRGRFEEIHCTMSRFSVVRKPSTDKEIRVYNKAKARGLKDEEVPQRGMRKFTVVGLGSSGGRGSSDFLFRPQFAIFDDMIGNEKDAHSEVYCESVESTIESDVGKSMSKSGYFNVFIGTVFHTGDPLYARATSGYHLPIVFPAAEEPPRTKDVYNKDGQLIYKKVLEKDFISVWKDRHTYKAQRAEFRKAEIALENNKPKPMRKTMQEFYLRVVSETERLIPAVDIQWMNMDNIKANAHLYTWLLATDLTTTGNPDSDDSAAFMWAIDWDDNFYLVDMALRKMHLDEQSNNLFNMIGRVKSYTSQNIDVEIAVEIDGQQSLHINNLNKYARENNLEDMLFYAIQATPNGKPPSHIGIRSHGAGDKLWRLKPFAEQKFNQKKVFLNEEYKTGNDDMATYLNELRLVTFSSIESKTDNGLDATSITTLVDYIIPPKPSPDDFTSTKSQYTAYDLYEESLYGNNNQINDGYNSRIDYYYGKG